MGKRPRPTDEAAPATTSRSAAPAPAEDDDQPVDFPGADAPLDVTHGLGADDAAAVRQPKAKKAKKPKAVPSSKAAAAADIDAAGAKKGTEPAELGAAWTKKSRAVGTSGATGAVVTSSGATAEGQPRDRFLLFIGNIPWAATREQILKHFACVGEGGIVGASASRSPALTSRRVASVRTVLPL
jgi:nucleolar protein 6